MPVAIDTSVLISRGAALGDFDRLLPENEDGPYNF